MKLRPGWGVEGGRHVHPRLGIVVDVLQGPGADGVMWWTILFWPRDGGPLAARQLHEAATSLGLKPGARYRASLVANEAGDLGLQLQWPLKNQPVYLDSELTEDDIARVIDPSFDAVAAIPLEPTPVGWLLAEGVNRKVRFIHESTKHAAIVSDQVLPGGPFCRTATFILGSDVGTAVERLWRVGSTFFGAGQTVYVVHRSTAKGAQTIVLMQPLDGSSYVEGEGDALVVERATLDAFARRVLGN
ncbi:MAG: hypothetical protein ACLQVI_02010 [Polyangiaceae bacterium]